MIGDLVWHVGGLGRVGIRTGPATPKIYFEVDFTTKYIYFLKARNFDWTFKISMD